MPRVARWQSFVLSDSLSNLYYLADNLSLAAEYAARPRVTKMPERFKIES